MKSPSLLLAALLTIGSSAAAQDTWTPLAPMPMFNPYTSPSGGLLGDTIYAFYGGNPNDGRQPFALAYSTITDEWTVLASPPYLGSAANDVPAINGKLYFTSVTYDCYGNSSAVWTFDGAVWQQPTTLPPGANLCSRAAANLNDKLYLVGGVYPWNGYDRVDVYDPVTNAWTSTTRFPHAIEDAAAAAIDGKLYVTGGFDRRTMAPTNELWRYDPADATWTALANMPAALHNHRSVALNGKLHILGGVDAQNHALTSHFVFDPAAGTWDAAAAMETPRFWQLAGSNGHSIYMTGGYSSYYLLNAATERYDETITPPTPHALTITTNDAWKEYGAPLPAFTVSYDGFVNGDTSSVLDGALSFSTLATAGSPLGAYQVTPSGVTSSTYAITFVPGTLTIVDTTPPVVTTPGDLVVDATSPAGAVVTFAAAAFDAVDGSVPATCAPASGSIIPAGTTTVSCSATDTQGNTSAAATFTVTVLGAAEIASKIVAEVRALRFQQSINLLQNAGCNQFNAFINQVRAQTGKQLTVAQAANLTLLASHARAALGCR